MLRYRVIPVTPFQQNCTVFWCDETREAAVVDPGGDLDRIQAVLQKEDLKLTKILLTHGHIDHAGATADLAASAGVPIEGPHKGDDYWIAALPEQSHRFGFGHARAFTPDRWLEDGDTVTVGKVTLQVLHCPGHTPGHVVFFDPETRLAQVGDVLFAGSIGRTDFPGGDLDTLVNSIRGKLFKLGDEVEFIPGHGPMSTMGDERATNPFVADRRFG